MTIHVELPNGGWAELKESEQLTNRDRKLLRRHLLPAVTVGNAMRDKMTGSDLDAIRADPTSLTADVGERVAEALSADDLDLLGDVQGALIVVYLSTWSLGDSGAEHYGADTAAMWAPHPGSKADVLVSPMPTMATVDDLPGPVYDILAAATASFGDGTVDFGVDGAADPASPTVPAAV